MSTGELQYWSAIAQIVPVLGLALVLEARTVSQRWDARTPRSFRRWQASFWLATVATLVLTGNIALTALRSDQAPGELGGHAATFSISFAVSTLVLGPVLQFFIAENAKSISRLAGHSPSAWWTMWRLKRTMRELGRLKVTTRRLCADAPVSIEKTIDYRLGLLARIDQHSGEIPEEMKELREEIAASLEDLEDKLREFRDRFHWSVLQELNWEFYARESLDVLQTGYRDISSSTRIAWVDALTTLTANQSGGVLPNSLDAQAPDDGGFYTERDRPALLMFANKPYRVSDYSEFDIPNESDPRAYGRYIWSST